MWRNFRKFSKGTIITWRCENICPCKKILQRKSKFTKVHGGQIFGVTVGCVLASLTQDAAGEIPLRLFGMKCWDMFSAPDHHVQVHMQPVRRSTGSSPHASLIFKCPCVWEPTNVLRTSLRQDVTVSHDDDVLQEPYWVTLVYAQHHYPAHQIRLTRAR